MAEEQDDSQKTEEPTQKRLDEAREKGQVASSREINHWFMILGGTLLVTIFAPQMMRDLARLMLPFVEQPDASWVEQGPLAYRDFELRRTAEEQP